MLDKLSRDLLRIYRRRSSQPLRFGVERDVYGGLETQTVSSAYQWDGMRRGGDPAHPYIIWQFTLDGWGYYATPHARTKVLPEMSFAAVIPSEHRYYLPPESASWTFFWMSISQPYVTQRIANVNRSCGAVLPIPADSLLLAKAARLFEGMCLASFRDGIAQEQAIFDFLFEYERHGEQLRYSTPERQRLLDEARAVVLENIRHPVDVEELAATRGMSRSHYSHFFKSATGLSPAFYATEVRLQEVSRRLVQTDEKLHSIARETGFADANHLCKVFRRHFHLSPGAFRRQMR